MVVIHVVFSVRTCETYVDGLMASTFFALNGLVGCGGVVTSLKEEHENSASRIFSNDRDCLAPHVHSRRAKGSVRPCRSEMTLDVESVVGGCVS